jgi:hypothetical protein
MNRIVRECLERGSYVLSTGSLEPAVVLQRLLDALRVVDPDSHQAFQAAGAYAAIPLEALRDELHRWWGSDEALKLVENLIVGIDLSMAPHGFGITLAANDRFLLEPLDGAPAPGGTASGPPPSVSALRARVR